MSTTVEKISSNKVKLSFDIDAAKFDEAMGQGIHQGARPGRDPRLPQGTRPAQDD